MAVAWVPALVTLGIGVGDSVSGTAGDSRERISSVSVTRISGFPLSPGALEPVTDGYLAVAFLQPSS